MGFLFPEIQYTKNNYESVQIIMIVSMSRAYCFHLITENEEINHAK